MGVVVVSRRKAMEGTGVVCTASCYARRPITQDDSLRMDFREQRALTRPKGEVPLMDAAKTTRYLSLLAIPSALL